MVPNHRTISSKQGHNYDSRMLELKFKNKLGKKSEDTCIKKVMKNGGFIKERETLQKFHQ